MIGTTLVTVRLGMTQFGNDSKVLPSCSGLDKGKPIPTTILTRRVLNKSDYSYTEDSEIISIR
jgi:hypothetical protein